MVKIMHEKNARPDEGHFSGERKGVVGMGCEGPEKFSLDASYTCVFIL